ncbi:hypothetical protein ACHAPD_002046 [Fusarium lateritium]
MQQQQPATVNPNEVLLNPGLSYTSQSYPSSAYQTDVYDRSRAGGFLLGGTTSQPVSLLRV